MTSSVCVQFTGGKDSTLLAALLAQRFDLIHLISFSNPLIVDLNKISKNVEKLSLIYGERKFIHTIVSNEKLMKLLYAGNWWRDIIRHRTYSANNVCGSCRLSMITLTILYCLKNGVANVCDGANKTGFDLSQQVWSLEVLVKFYQEYHIHYEHLLYKASRNDIDLLKLGLSAEKPQLLYRSQPLCKGGGEVHNIYLRCYYLPRYGRERRREQDLKWLQDKLDLCREYISSQIT